MGKFRLTPRQQKFCIEYSKSGEIAKALEAAGYSGARGNKTGQEILRRPEAREYIESLKRDTRFCGVADMEEIKAFWSSVMRDPDAKAAERLKASELCAKAQGMFTDRGDTETHTEWFKE